MLVQQFFGIDTYSSFLHSQFVPFKAMIDEEAGGELKERYGIDANPSLCLIEPDGSVYDILVGYDGKPDEYLKRIRTSLDGEDTFVSFKKAYDANPGDLRTAYALAEKYQRMFQMRPAIELCSKMLERPEETKTLTVAFQGKQANLYEVCRYAQAMGMFYERQTVKGMETFRKEFPATPLAENVYTNLMYWYLQLPVSDGSRAFYREAMAKFPDNPRMAWGIVRFLTRTGENFEEGDAFAKKLIASDAENAGNRETAAGFYLKHGKTDQALECYGDDFAQKLSEYKNPLNSYAWFWAEQEKNLPSALEAIRKAALLDPKDDNIYDTMSYVYWKMKEYGKAIEAEEKALSMKPGNEDYIKRIADIKKDMTAEQP